MSYYEYHVAKRYVQFENALHEFSKYAAFVGRKLLILTACGSSREDIITSIEHSFSQPCQKLVNADLIEESPRYAGYVPLFNGMDARIQEMSWEFYDIEDLIVNEKNIRHVADYAASKEFDTVVGIGGGRALDFSRALTHFLPLHVILVPTLCATNASISTLSVIYSDDGSKIHEYWRMDNAPDLVLADTRILISNGPAILAAGIGDIISTYLEAICNIELAGNEKSFSSFSVEGVRLAVQIMMKEGPVAIKHIQTGTISPAIETVLSMILHNNGPLWSICTLGLAHVIDEVFLFFDESHRIPHGLRVGYAALMMLQYQQVSHTLFHEYYDFCKTVGIPVSIKDLGLADIPVEKWDEAIQKTVEKSGTRLSLPFHISKSELLNLICNGSV